MRNDLGASQKEIEFTNGTVSPLSCADDDGDDEEEEEEEEEEEPNKEEEEEEEDEEPVRTAGSQSVPRPESGGSVNSKYQ